MDRQQKCWYIIQKCSIAILTAFGQFPFKYDTRRKEYVFNFRSWSFVWTLVVNLLNVLGIQGVAAFLWSNFWQPRPQSISFHSTVLILMIFLLGVHILMACVLWIIFGRRLLSVDAKYLSADIQLRSLTGKPACYMPKSIPNGQRFLVAVLILVGLLSTLANASSATLMLRTYMTNLLDSKVQALMKPGFNYWPIIYYIIPNAEICSIIAGVVVAAMHFTSAMSEVIVLVVSRRLLVLVEHLIDQVQIHNRNQEENVFHMSNILTSIVQPGKKPKSYPGLKFLDIGALKRQMELSHQLFLEFSRACGFIILVEISYNLIVACITVFHGLRIITTGNYDHTKYELALFLALVHAVFKMIVLTNLGQSWVTKNAELQTAIASVEIDYDPSGAEQLKLLHLKQYANSLDFRLSGCGFFVLSRETFTSIIGAIVTYTIVLIQFDPSNKRY